MFILAMKRIVVFALAIFAFFYGCRRQRAAGQL